MSEEPPGDQIVLTLPAAPEFVRIARLTGAGLATRIGMGYDEVEDLRIAVGEACSVVIGPGSRPGVLTLTFVVSPDSLHVEVVGALRGGRPPDELATDLSDQILDAVVDEHEVDLPRDRVWVTKRLETSLARDPGGGSGSG